MDKQAQTQIGGVEATVRKKKKKSRIGRLLLASSTSVREKDRVREAREDLYLSLCCEPLGSQTKRDQWPWGH